MIETARRNLAAALAGSAGKPQAGLSTEATPSFDGTVLVAIGLALAALSAAYAFWEIDRSTLRWIHYLRRLAEAYGNDRFSIRFKRDDDAPAETASLGHALNDMADNAERAIAGLDASNAERQRIAKEMQHRVRNNFQVLGSLLSLMRRRAPETQHDDIRLVEDHINALVAVDRLVFAVKTGACVPLRRLIEELVSGLLAAGAEIERLPVRYDSSLDPLSLEPAQAVALGLRLQALLPERLARATAVEPLTIAATDNAPAGITVTLDHRTGPPRSAEPRLIGIHRTELAAMPPVSTPSGLAVTIPPAR